MNFNTSFVEGFLVTNIAHPIAIFVNAVHVIASLTQCVECCRHFAAMYSNTTFGIVAVTKTRRHQADVSVSRSASIM